MLTGAAVGLTSGNFIVVQLICWAATLPNLTNLGNTILVIAPRINSRIVSLGMYDQPFLHSTNDLLWQELCHCIIDIDAEIDLPVQLNRDMSLTDQWLSADLLLSQTCGFPYITRFHEHLQLVATPVYVHEGCDAAEYSSFLIARTGNSPHLHEYRGTRLAANAVDSLSGFVSLQIKLFNEGLRGPFFKQCILSSAHARSLQMVAQDEADLCCIDTVTWGLLIQQVPALRNKLQVIAQTPRFPALPLVASKTLSAATVDVLREALDRVIDNPRATLALQKLGIKEFRQLTHRDYRCILDSHSACGDYQVAEQTE